MKAILVGLYDRGKLSDERVHFRALFDLDLSYYVIFDSFYSTPSTISVTQKTCYWFTSRQIKAGENLVLYTRAGTPSTERRADGSIYHFVFRGLSRPLYADPNACAVLFELTTWATTK